MAKISAIVRRCLQLDSVETGHVRCSDKVDGAPLNQNRISALWNNPKQFLLSESQQSFSTSHKIMGYAFSVIPEELGRQLQLWLSVACAASLAGKCVLL